MSFPRNPGFSNSEIDEAGDILLSGTHSLRKLLSAHDVVAKWRAAHAYPINTFRATLSVKTRSFRDPLIAQRLKRLPTIIQKLKRIGRLNLSELQDIGGLRAVLKSVPDVRKLEEIYRKKSRFKHRLVKSNDYIAHPKPSGYRGVHLIYSYKNDQSALSAQYNGLQIELQLRTKLQHTWATAVETMGTFLGQSLKSSQGERRWLEFFKTVSAAFAHIENSPPVPGFEHKSKKEVFARVKKCEKAIQALQKMESFTAATIDLRRRKGRTNYLYHLIVLDSENRTTDVSSYKEGEFGEATKDYSAAEARASKGEKIEPVLVSARNLLALRLAYPSYFLDMSEFRSKVQNIIAQAD